MLRLLPVGALWRGVVDPGLTGWAVILGMSALPLLAGQVLLLWARQSDRGEFITIE